MFCTLSESFVPHLPYNRVSSKTHVYTKKKSCLAPVVIKQIVIEQIDIK